MKTLIKSDLIYHNYSCMKTGLKCKIDALFNKRIKILAQFLYWLIPINFISIYYYYNSIIHLCIN